MAQRDAQRLTAHLSDMHEMEDLNEIEKQAVRQAIEFLQGRGELTKEEAHHLNQTLDQIDTNTLKRYNVR